jgi:hypothetical protein
MGAPHSVFGHAVLPLTVDRLGRNPAAFVHDAKRERVRRLRLAGDLISPFDIPKGRGISLSEELWISAAIERAADAKLAGDLPMSGWINPDGTITPQAFDASWLALNMRQRLTVTVARQWTAADLAAWIAQYPSERSMIDHVERAVWPEGPVCHRCGRREVARSPRRFLDQLYCGTCHAEFSALQLLGISGSHWDLRTWFVCIFLQHCDALTIPTLARAVHMSKQTVWSAMVRGTPSHLTPDQWQRLIDVIVFAECPIVAAGDGGERLAHGRTADAKSGAPPFAMFRPPDDPAGLRGSAEDQAARAALAQRIAATKAQRRAELIAAGLKPNLGGRRPRHPGTMAPQSVA